MAEVRRVACMLRLLGRDGRALAGARLAVVRAAGAVPEMAYVADADGRLRIGLPPGEAEVRIFPPAGEPRLASFHVGDADGHTYDLSVDA